MSTKRFPKYASKAPRNRLVEILCCGKCNCARIAHIADTAKSSVGTVIDTSGYAECLFCGYRGTDY
jgi:hypothetical protein